MPVLNIHERALGVAADKVGQMLDSLASKNDALWPRHSWPPMKFDRPLCVGADGGHGPIRYFVESYSPGQSIWFRFKGPKGFHGTHGVEVIVQSDQTTLLRHTLKMSTTWPAVLTWPLLFRPMHDALIEDALTQAEASLGLPVHVKKWSWRVKLLRWLVSRGKARSQADPNV
jgi:hypothetical protein